MSTRVSACTALAAAIKELGFRGDLGYYQLLYPAEVDVRHVFMFLVKEYSERIDIQKSSKPGDEASGSVLFGEVLGKELQAICKQTWLPMYCTTRPGKPLPSRAFHSSFLRVPVKPARPVPGLEEYFSKYMPFLSDQVEDVRDLPASVFEYNARAVAEAKEREAEWNQVGLESGLKQAQYQAKKKAAIARRMANIFQTSANSSLDNGSSSRLSNSLSALMSAYEKQANVDQGTFTRQVKYGQKQDEVIESLEERKAKQNKEFEEKQAQHAKLCQELGDTTQGLDDFTARMKQLEADIKEAEVKREPLETEFKMKKRIQEMLPDAEANILMLQQVASKTSEHLIHLANEWEAARMPLIVELRRLADMQYEARGDSRVKAEEIKKLRVQANKLISEIKQKDERCKQLAEVYKSLPREMDRPEFTRRILEIIKNVKKQQSEIKKILEDTRSLQKEIGTVSDTLGRSFALAEDMIYQDAKKEGTGAKQSAAATSAAAPRKHAYKQIVAIDENFKKLVAATEEMGATLSRILNLESKIEQVQARTSNLNMDRVESDLKQVKQENAQLKVRVQALEAGLPDPADKEPLSQQDS
eukprot:TRINITY_DN1542_c0_g1_i2.p1 TRINITY_DN1542_c0_g1~~TRINITY_DN1542_c0_g1_i2.p1  ORF type:complete len:587 (-),score=213.72 TRINITY_DN1542_c0_g1_i2:49-1809(-)